jgi:hypothetical protein
MAETLGRDADVPFHQQTETVPNSTGSIFPLIAPLKVNGRVKAMERTHPNG